MDLSISDYISIISAAVAISSVFYARRAVDEAKRSNDIGLLNALLELRIHYHELINNKGRAAESVMGMKGSEKFYDDSADIDSRLREVTKIINEYHDKVVSQKP